MLPEPEEVEIEIKKEDVIEHVSRSSGPGGQNVNKVSSAIKLEHIPTGITVSMQDEKSQHKNRASAMRVLRSRLYQLAREEQQAEMQKYEENKKKIEWGSQIRSYVFHPYNMVKDHRTTVQTSDIQKVMDGDLEIFINAYLTQGQDDNNDKPA